MFELLEKQSKSKNKGAVPSTAFVTALYERLSRDDDNEGESNSIVNQKNFLETYARENGFTNCRHYTDDGYSGGNFDRPGWQQMLADIEGGIVKTVLVKDMSRVGRNYVETGFYTEIYFARMDVRFIAINNSIDNEKPDSTEYAGILNIMNDWYLRDTSRKIRSALQQKGKSGEPLSANPCFGYIKDPEDKNHWVIEPEAADTVRRIYELAASGMSQLKICRTLAKEKRCTPGYYLAQKEPEGRGKAFLHLQPYQWTRAKLYKLVNRREYLGHTINFKTCYPEYRSKQINVPVEKQLVFKGTHEAIVDADTWEKAQRIYHPEISNKPGGPSSLSGLMVCGECGVLMRFHRVTRDEKENDFVCRTYKESGSYGARFCYSNSIRETLIRKIIRDTLRKVNRYAIKDEAAFRCRVEQEALTWEPEEKKALSKHIREKEKKIARLDHLLKKLYEDYALGRIPEERFDLLSNQYEQEESELKTELTEDQARLNAAQTSTKQADKYLALAHKYRDCTELTDEMIRAFVEKIVVYKSIKPEKGRRIRQIDVHLNYIGSFHVPADGTENE